MALPRFVVLRSDYNNKYLCYIEEDVEVYGFLQFTEENVMSPYAKFEVVMAKSGKGLVNIRCCHNNKYWVRWSENHYWIVAGADEPEEDKSKWSCTLFEPIYVDAKTIRFRHVQLGHYACLWRMGKGNIYDSCLFAGSNAHDRDQCDVCTIIDWESLSFKNMYIVRNILKILSGRSCWPRPSSRRPSPPTALGDETSKMELPRFMVLKSIYNSKYLQYVKEDVQMHGFLQFSGDEVVSPYAKYEVEMAKSGRGLVNIRCCYNNKYWVRRSQNPYWIVAEADEPEEDISKWSCTLFDPIYVDATSIRFRHVQLGHYTCVWRTGGVYDSCLFAGSNAPDGDQCDIYTIIDWESLLILPKHVAFKGDNGNYLSARMIHRYPYLQFASNDIGDPTVGNEVFTTRDGSVRIKSNHFGKFWRASPSWIWADSDDTSSHKSDTLFWPIKVDNRVVALRNLGNNNFCKRLSTQGKTDCLSAAISTISKEARLEVVELVLSRAIYNVNYRLKDARIYNQSVLTMANGTAINGGKEPSSVELKLQYTESRSKTWNASVSLKLGIKTSIQTGVPLIAEGKIEIGAEFTGEYQWGQTDESSTVVETVYTVTVPPMTMVKVSLLATKGSCDVPFSYSQRDTLINGQQITSTMDDGVYTAINCFNFKYENKPFKLEYPDESLISISGNPTTESSNAVVQSPIGAYLKPISVGPFGGHGGQEWDDGIYTTIRQLIINYGLLVDSIQIEYDENGSSKWSEKHGKSEGGTKRVVKLDYPGEFLVSISGHYGKAPGEFLVSGKVTKLLVIRSLKIESNKRTYGPFGVEQGEYFKFPSTSSKIRGFHGRSGLFLDSIGAYVE